MKLVSLLSAASMAIVLSLTATSQAGGHVTRAPAALGSRVRIRLPQTRRIAAVAEETHAEATLRYASIKTMVKHLLTEYPPDHHYFVGVGRTPTAMVAFMENLSDDLATQVPASGLKRGISDDRLQAYYDHFDRFIPASVLRGNRTIVFIDGSYGGGSALTLRDAFDSYQAERGGTAESRAVVFNELAGTTRRANVDIVGVGAAYYLQQSEPFAMLSTEHNIGEHGHELATLRDKANPEYARFRRGLMQYMHEDTADLGPWLKQRFPRLGAKTP